MFVTKHQSLTSLGDTVTENEEIKDNVEDNQATLDPVRRAGTAASTTTSVTTTEIVYETTTQVGRDGSSQSRPQEEEKTLAAALQDTAAATAHQAQETRDEHAKAIILGLESE